MSEKAANYIIVAACPRSGTFYMHTVLRFLGLAVGHEAPRYPDEDGDNCVDGVVGWPYMWWEHPYVQDAKALAGDRGIAYFHQVRHPLTAIRAMEYMYRSGNWPPFPGPIAIPPPLDYAVTDTSLKKAMKLWYNWNGLADAEWHRFRIEDIDDIWPAFCGLVGLPEIPLPDVPKDTNSHKAGGYLSITWEDMEREDLSLTGRIKSLAASYGY